eukprot:TRINITY_DN1205_c0_g1_i1.p1 TRINITY_DN1205_c0_g1~~TRINITY_DN1205_c0_g1_i1.p1  ORF type:complete len:592 (+),score=183.89 TRINITY_DN1205_c0_g1_i1:54-1829(+)
MSRVLLRAAVSAVLLSASDAVKTSPDGPALLSTAIRSNLQEQAMATADDAVREAEAELAQEMAPAEPEEKKKEVQLVKKEVPEADKDFITDGDDTATEDEKDDDEEDAPKEKDTKDTDGKKKDAAKKDDTKETATKDKKKETTKAAEKDDKKKETTKAAKTDDKKQETETAAKKDSKKDAKPDAKSDSESKKSKDAKSDKKKDDKADAKDATQGKKKEAAKQEITKNDTDSDADMQNKTEEKEITKNDTDSDADMQNKTEEKAIPKFGNPKCLCIGLEGVKGDLVVSVGGNKTVDYPAEAFASCAAWDDESHPACEKDGGAWCKQPWCLVDPCNCELDIAPKKVTGGYWPGGDFQGMGGYWYSYATCGGVDVWADADSQKKMAEEPKECDKKVEETKWGDAACQCIGVDGRPGTLEVQISKNVTARYPVDAGATCKAWDVEYHPDCQGKDAPDWCKEVWCFVDPCSCAIPVSPKLSNYMKDATWSGRPVYYSYDTCGGNDTYTGSQENACVNQQSEIECGKQSRCAWDGQQCLGKELVKVCKKAAKAVASATAAQEEAAEEVAEKTQERSGALLPAAPFLATFLACVASSV